MKNQFLFLIVAVAFSLTAFTIQTPKSQMETTPTADVQATKAVVEKFYKALSTTPTDQAATEAATWMIANWTSTPTPPGGPNLEGFVKTLHMFHGMIPDLKWEVEEMLADGNRVIVRSTASGTPNSPEGHFFGVPTDGSKSFSIQTIDIHTVENGLIVRSYHTEDWAAAIQQVSSNAGH